jgi:hypothetical protein
MNHTRAIAAAMLLSAAALTFSAMTATAQQSDDMHNMPGMKMQMEAAPVKDVKDGGAASKGDLAISGGFVRAMLPGQPVGGGYLTIHNGGSNDDRLVSVVSPDAGKVELHEMKMDNNIMKMRQLKDGVAVPAGATVKLEPDTMHMMFKQVKTPFKQGATVPVTLTFEKAGAVDLVLPVHSMQAD